MEKCWNRFFVVNAQENIERKLGTGSLCDGADSIFSAIQHG